MQRIDADIMFRLGAELRALRDSNKPKLPLYAIFHPWSDAIDTLNTLINSLSLRMCREAVARLERVGKYVFSDFYAAGASRERFEEPHSEVNVDLLSAAINEVEIVIRAEIRQVEIYFASPVGIYATSELIERADELFSDDMRAVLSESAREDIRYGGKCLAFGLPDAAAFHILKATEEVMRELVACVSRHDMPRKSRNWGEYIKSLREAEVDSKIAEYLDYIRRNHRNPVLHPEDRLTKDEAVALFDAASNAIVPMAKAISRISKSASDAPNAT